MQVYYRQVAQHNTIQMCASTTHYDWISSQNVLLTFVSILVVDENVTFLSFKTGFYVVIVSFSSVKKRSWRKWFINEINTEVEHTSPTQITAERFCYETFVYLLHAQLQAATYCKH